jgi:hypothetical protein
MLLPILADAEDASYLEAKCASYFKWSRLLLIFCEIEAVYYLK